MGRGPDAANARKAAQDDSAIAYLGEFNSGASANSIPIINEAGILQVSPSNTAFGLTKGGTGAEPGEPDKYYPTGKRTYGRVVPIDTIQGAARPPYMKDEGVKSVYILDDKEVYGQGVATNTEAAAEEAGLKIAGNDSGTARRRTTARSRPRSRPRAPTPSSPAASSTTTARSCSRTSTPPCRTPRCSAPTAWPTDDFTKEIPDKVQTQTYLTAPTVSPDELPPAGQKFYEDYEAEYGEAQDEIDPYAVYGYEAMAVVLDAIAAGRRRPPGGHRRVLRDEGTGERARHVRHRSRTATRR